MDIYDKWIDSYIKNIDLNKIEWICLKGDELDEFYQNNYLDYAEAVVRAIAMYTGYKFIGILGMLVGPIVLIIVKNIFFVKI